MRRAMLGTAAIAAVLLFGAAAAAAESRVALVIGQSAYRAVPALPNPVNDAKAIAALLGEAGFEVTEASDLGQTELRAKVGDFAATVAAKGPETVALMFYAGHGIQVDGENYLIPVDVDPKREADIPLQAVRLDDVLNTLSSVPSKTRIIMLDACRNNPFPSINKTTGQGLALVDTKAGAPGTLLSYSTSPGAEAEDGGGSNSPYTTALLKAGRENGLKIEDTFKRVRLAVNQATEGRQTPWESSSLVDDFHFFAPAAAEATAAPGDSAAPKPRTVEEWRGFLKGKPVDQANALIVSDGSADAYEAFVSLYAEPPFAPDAKRWLDRHRRMQAWNRAVLANTGSAYTAFLAEYPASDLTATARKLAERLRYRPDNAVVVPTAALATPVAAAAALTCPCGPRPPALQKVEPKKTKSRAERDDPPKRSGKKASRNRVYVEEEDDVVVVRRPPVYVVPPGPVIQFGGGFRGGYGGGPSRGGDNYGPSRGRY
ncbi:caspase family protein [Rhodopseudomonas sp. WA056]|uniref:caspase family protein n=1 Tax=Rhodopseudomonas sp. WA056 TaxID=2269367 RepID=UPI0013E0D043|nr:caspase family protein [Rhodopseudomonas sp. WA056]NEW89395.1 caspase family protein [Rhodopseudomonas sp. WA056]